MNWQPLLAASTQIRLHVASVALALFLVPIQLALPKGTSTHRAIGWAWVVALCSACISALFILDHAIPPNIAGVSWLHLLAIFTLVMLWQAVRMARRGDVKGHRIAMLCLVFLGLGLPLAFAFAIPGRIMNRIFFN